MNYLIISGLTALFSQLAADRALAAECGLVEGRRERNGVVFVNHCELRQNQGAFNQVNAKNGPKAQGELRCLPDGAEFLGFEGGLELIRYTACKAKMIDVRTDNPAPHSPSKQPQAVSLSALSSVVSSF